MLKRIKYIFVFKLDLVAPYILGWKISNLVVCAAFLYNFSCYQQIELAGSWSWGLGKINRNRINRNRN